jgi:hypothetical protein
MTFFNSISVERKVQLVDVKVNVLREQIYGLLLNNGLNPEDVDMSQFDLDAEWSVESESYETELRRLLGLIQDMQTLRTEIIG